MLSDNNSQDFVKDAAITLGAKYSSDQDEEDEASDDEAIKQKIIRMKEK